MEYLKRVKSGFASGVSTVESKVREVSYGAEIQDRRLQIRKMKGEWGRYLYDFMGTKGKKERLKSSHQLLEKEIVEKQNEIHEYENKWLRLHHRATLPVKKDKVKKKAPSPADDNFRCQRCNGIRENDTILTCGDFTFHPRCFTCRDCAKDVSSETQCSVFDGLPACEACGHKRLKSQFETFDDRELKNFCAQSVKGFRHVEFVDFEPFTWLQNGLLFAALCANWRPDLIHWDSILKDHPEKEKDGINLNPMQVGLDALSKAGVPMFLYEADDVRDCDRKTIMTQVTAIQYHFSNEKPHPDARSIWNQQLAVKSKDEIYNGRSLHFDA